MENMEKGVGMSDDDDSKQPTVGFTEDSKQPAPKEFATTSTERANNLLTRSMTTRMGDVNREKHKKIKKSHTGFLIWPWEKAYRSWWGFTVFCALLTIFTETYAIAFLPAGLQPFNNASSIMEYVLVGIFGLDICFNFNLAYFDEDDEVVTDRAQIAWHYFYGNFWYDFAGVFPFYHVALAIAGEVGQDSQTAQFLALLRLVKLVRLHRAKELFDILQYNTQVSLFQLTLVRNFCFCFVWSHFSACVFYFIARQYDFDVDTTWIGGSVQGLNGFERYLTSLYWSVVTFTTVGYGDYSPVNSAEQIWGMLYMLLNIIAQAWMIGSITLLIVKQDEKTGAYRDTMETLASYANLNEFPKKLHKSLKMQLKLEFNSRELSDEMVLSNFPSAVRRKVLRRLYLPYLMQTSLMSGIRQQFVDAFLSACKVEIFSPGEEILCRGSVCSDLYLLVSGVVKTSHAFDSSTADETNLRVGASNYAGTSIGDSSERHNQSSKTAELGAGEFINEIGFFTESPQVETVKTKTICKTLTMSRETYKSIAEDHPGSVGKVLQNLLDKVEAEAARIGVSQTIVLPTRLTVLRAGSTYDDTVTTHLGDDFAEALQQAQTEAALGSVTDIVRSHMNKQKDDNTTRFLFAASRGDTSTITLMCDQGFDPDTADYDSRTALMVAAMKGNTDTVAKILDYQANPDLVDMHGTSALYEATRNGHEATMDVILNAGGTLCMDEAQAAGKLCETVFNGDILSLRRLLRARIQVNAGDYDKRTCAHIAAAEGNLVAIKLLVEYGADLKLPDRWGNTVFDEAKRINENQLLEYLEELERKESKKE